MTNDRIGLNSANSPLPFLMVLATDNRSPAPGLLPSLVARISKNAGPFDPPGGLIGEIGHGWYAVNPSALDTDTAGPLILHVSDLSGVAAPKDDLFWVVPSLSTSPVVQGSQTTPIPFLMVSSSDHVTGLAGLSPGVLIAKDANGFAPPDTATQVMEIGGPGAGAGWYYLSPNPTDLDTPGPLLLNAQAANADVTDYLFPVAPAGGLAQTTLADVLLGFRAAVINAGIFPQINIYISLEEEPFPFGGGPGIIVSYDNDLTIEPFNDGAGRFATCGTVKVKLSVYDQSYRDAGHEDTLRLTRANDGLIRKAHSLINSIHDTDLRDAATGNIISIEPVRWEGTMRARKWNRSKGRPSGGGDSEFQGWAGVELNFEAKYQLSLDNID